MNVAAVVAFKPSNAFSFGKVKVKVKVTYTPNDISSGDVVGDSNTQTTRVKLIKHH